MVVVLDHSARTGMKPKITAGLFHRTDPQAVKDDFVRAGFIFDGEVTALRNPGDHFMQSVFDDNVRYKLEQFIFFLRRP